MTLKTLCIPLISALVAGCTSVGAPKMDGADSVMNAAIQAKSQAKSGDAGCFKATGPLGAWAVIMTWMNIETGIIRNGKVAVGENCELELTNASAKVTP